MGRIPPCTQSHIICLLGAIVSSIVLAVTVNCVWYPYLQTASFYPSVCTVGNVATVYGATACQSSQCPSGAPPSPSPPYYTVHLNTSRTPPSFPSTTLPTTGQNTPQETAEATTNESTTSPPTISSTSFSTSRPTTSSTLFSIVTHGDLTTPSWLSQPGCTWFPCVKLPVYFKASGDILIVAGSGQLYPNYWQLQNYPSCSYSSCQSNNQDNVNAIRDWVNSIVSQDQFQCYVNEYNFNQILQQVNFTYAAAINSILWPIISLTIFGSLFIALRIAAYCPKNRTRHEPTRPVVDDTISATPYSVNYMNTGNAGMGAPGDYAIHLPLPPAYQDVAGAGFSNAATIDQKNPADFADVRGNADGDLSTAGAAAAGQWVVMYPPNYMESSPETGDKKLPVVATSGGPFEDGAVAFSYPTPRSLTPGAVSGPIRVTPVVATETDLGVAGASARY